MPSSRIIFNIQGIFFLMLVFKAEGQKTKLIHERRHYIDSIGEVQWNMWDAGDYGL